MKSIWKYELKITDEQNVSMKEGAEILSVDVQRETICLWAIVNPSAKAVDRTFRVFGTGHPIHDTMLESSLFLGTVQLRGGSLVFHVFEDLTNPKSVEDLRE